MNKEIKKQYFKASLQIFLLIAATFAFSYEIRKISDEEKGIIVGDDKVKDIGLSLDSQRQTEVNTNVLDYKISEGESILASVLSLIGGTIFDEKTLVSAQQVSAYTCLKSKEGKI